MKISETWERLKNKMKNVYGASDSTITNYNTVINKFIAYVGDKDVKEITQSDVEDFLANEGKEVSKSTLKIYYYALKVLLNEGENRNVDWKKIKIKAPARVFKILTPEEIKKLFDAAMSINTRYYLMIRTGFELATRAQELLNIELKDFDPDNCTIFVKRLKGGTSRKLPISQELCAEIKEYIAEFKPKRYLFETKFHKKFTRQAFYEIFDQIAKKANVVVRPHDFFRHTAGTYLLKTTKDLYFVMQFMGHKDPQTTAQYMAYYDEDIRKRFEEALRSGGE